MIGFITNQMFDTPKVVNDVFDASLPKDHYPKKRKDELKQLTTDQQVTLRIDDLHQDIRWSIFNIESKSLYVYVVDFNPSPCIL